MKRVVANESFYESKNYADIWFQLLPEGALLILDAPCTGWASQSITNMT